MGSVATLAVNDKPMAEFGVRTGSLYLSPQNAIKQLPSTGGEKLPVERREMPEGVIRAIARPASTITKGTPRTLPVYPDIYERGSR